MLTASVPQPTSSTGSQSWATAISVSACASTPMTTPTTACADRLSRRETRDGARPSNASAAAAISPANRAGEGTARASSPAVPAAVSTRSSTHRPTGCAGAAVTPRVRRAGPGARCRRRAGRR